MDIRKKLNEVQNTLSDGQEEERNIVNDLMFLMFGRDSEELPKEFEIECMPALLEYGALSKHARVADL